MLRMNQVDQIKELQRQGVGPQEIASRLRLDRKTVTRYMACDNYDRKLAAKTIAAIAAPAMCQERSRHVFFVSNDINICLTGETSWRNSCRA